MLVFGKDDETKQELRQRILTWRRSLSAEEVQRQSAAIFERLLCLPAFVDASPLLSYFPGKDNEVDTRPMIQYHLGQGNAVFIPATAPRRQLNWRQITDLNQVHPGPYGIPQPPPDAPRCPELSAFACMLVPGVVFDGDRGRIGYGKGYFDRYLSAYPGRTIGLAFEGQIVPRCPLQRHDVRMHGLVTVDRTYCSISDY